MDLNSIVIIDMEFYLPEKIVTNHELAEEHPEWNIASLEPRIGVCKRHVATENETALDLAEKAAARLFSRRPELRDEIDAILFCTETPDFKLPPNACILHKKIGLSTQVAAFDYNLACSGFPYGLAIARGLICSGMANKVLLVNADTYTKIIHPDDRSCRVLFGDGAAVTVIGQEEKGLFHIVDIDLGTCGEHYERFIVPSGGCRPLKGGDAENDWRFSSHINMDGFGIRSFVMKEIPTHITNFLARNMLEKEMIDYWVFHQASGIILDSLAKRLKIPSDKIPMNMLEIGNTVSASIPVLLMDTLAKGVFGVGSRIVATGFGVGLSWGSVLLRS